MPLLIDSVEMSAVTIDGVVMDVVTIDGVEVFSASTHKLNVGVIYTDAPTNLDGEVGYSALEIFGALVPNTLTYSGGATFIIDELRAIFNDNPFTSFWLAFELGDLPPIEAPAIIILEMPGFPPVTLTRTNSGSPSWEAPFNDFALSEYLLANIGVELSINLIWA